jgi:hypothetical protein
MSSLRYTANEMRQTWFNQLKQMRLAVIAVSAGLALVASSAALAADTVPPTVPANFQATVVGGDPAVTLTWAAATDAGGVKAYRVDRSLDQAGWETLSSAIAELKYKDITSGFGLHYFYRLSAIDTAGNMSGWATTDVSTDNVGVSENGSTEATYTSQDKLAVVQLPAGLVAGSEISCQVNDLTDVRGKKVGDKSQPVVLGPYELACKTVAGSVITDYKKQVTWTLDLKGQLKNLHSPVAYMYGADGGPVEVKGVRYSDKDQTMVLQAPADAIVVVQASVPQGVSPNFLVVFLVVAGIVAAIIVFALNRKKKLQYEEYLRSKYYEL